MRRSKILFLFILPAILIVFFVNPSFAIPEFSADEIATGAFVILKGEVLSYTEQGQYRYYEIKVDEYIKNSHQEENKKEVIVMRSFKPEFINPIDPYSTFEKGDYIFAYLFPLDETRYNSGNFSHKIDSLDSYGRYDHRPDTIPENNIYKSKDPVQKIPEPGTKPVVPSPLQQIKNGISENDILCNAGFSLVYKKHDHSPVCITNGNIFDLIERGWAKNIVETSGSAWDTAEQFLEFSPTYQFDGKRTGTGISHLVTDDSFEPEKVLLLADYTKYYEGYGDRSNQNLEPLPDYDNRAEMLLQIQGKQVISAVINNEWDEIYQEFIANKQDSYEDFRIIYQKNGGITGFDIRYEIESKPGILRLYDHPDDRYIPISRDDAELFWDLVESSKIMLEESQWYDDDPDCTDCISYGLSVTSEDDRVEFYWSDGIEADEKLYDIAMQIESIVKQFEKRDTFSEISFLGVDFSLDDVDGVLEPEPMPEPEPEP